MRNARQPQAAKRDRRNRSVIANLIVVSLLLGLTGLTIACGANSQSGTVSSDAPAAAISLSPGAATLASLEQLQFTAHVSGTPNTAVTWSASAGTISPTGFFTAPNVATNTPVVVTAALVAIASTPRTVGVGTMGPTNEATAGSRASATVTVTPQASLAIGTSAIPAAEISTPYSFSLSATGGGTPYRWSLINGRLPSGIQLQGSSGAITGTSAVSGSFPFTAKVTDSSGGSATGTFVLTVSPTPANGFDGPAELPLIYIQTAMSNTPAPGSTITVNSGGNLQSALNSASCGDTIQLQAGATFSGLFTFPALNCDDNHWIIVRTSASDSVLPAEGNRLTPCYAGVASLPGRPAFQCPSTNNVTAKILLPSGDNGPIIFAAGANHYRLIGLEVTRLAGTGIVTALASIAAGGTANNLIFDRVWMHGTAQDETTRGIDLGGSTYVSAIDSFFTDFHCISVTGSCTDAQAINGGLGSDPMGPYKIVDNFLEASGESILFGGGAATLAPADIQISQNHMFKPLTWMQGQPGYVGGANGNPFNVKNLFELKNAQRVLLEGNIMEDTWGGFTQVGFAILLTPKNQSGTNGSNLCPACLVTDVTIRYSTISHVGAGLQIANALSDNGGAPTDGQRYSIHDITIDDIDGVKYDGPGQFAQVSMSTGVPLLQNVTINHITAFPPSTMFIIGAFGTQMKNFVFTNSIVTATPYPIWSTGGTTNCAYYDKPLTTFNACFSPYAFASNAMIATPAAYPASLWPSGNFFPANAQTVQFVNYNGGDGGNYQLQPSSPYAGKGTDGKDLGADMAAIDSAIAGVE
jgi:hypothetical protein